MRVAGCTKKISATEGIVGEIGGTAEARAHMWREVVVDIFLPSDDEHSREMGSMNLSRGSYFCA